jgi:hypothetical protein
MRQSFRGNAGSSSQNIPPDWLPPGMPPEQMAQKASAMTSATYRISPGYPAVNVHVLEIPPGRSAPGREIAVAIGSASGDSKTTGIEVRSPEGELYQGWRVLSAQIQVFVLQSANLPIVIVIYSPEPSVHPVAERLARNVSNGQGLRDYPEFNNSIGVLPAQLPAGMELEGINTFAPEDLGLSAGQISAQLGGEVGSEVHELVGQLERFIPRRITAARYRDAAQQPWELMVGDYESTLKAIGIWVALRLLGTAGMNSVDTEGGSGLWMDLEAEGRVLILRAGPSIVALKGPSGAPLETFIGLADGLQL